VTNLQTQQLNSVKNYVRKTHPMYCTNKFLVSQKVQKVQFWMKLDRSKRNTLF